jgi:N-acetylglucosaminyldiphosphoundecaprenol N-acetyl-beta-D-mannosaminyltransferase
MFGRNEERLLKLIGEWRGVGTLWIATVNPEFVMNALKDGEFMKILQNRVSLNVVDGIGLVWANKIMGEKSKVKRLLQGFKTGVEILQGKNKDMLISGADLVNKICGLAEEKNKRVFFLGGWGDRGQRTAEYFLKKYPKLNVAGWHSGNRVGEDDEIVSILSRHKIDYLLVAYKMKTQEEWINRNIDKLKVELVMGVGGTFDFYSGAIKRAPLLMRKMGLEWLYRLYMEPSRWKRQLDLPRFIVKVLKAD